MRRRRCDGTWGTALIRFGLLWVARGRLFSNIQSWRDRRSNESRDASGPATSEAVPPGVILLVAPVEGSRSHHQTRAGLFSRGVCAAPIRAGGEASVLLLSCVGEGLSHHLSRSRLKFAATHMHAAPAFPPAATRRPLRGIDRVYSRGHRASGGHACVGSLPRRKTLSPSWKSSGNISIGATP